MTKILIGALGIRAEEYTYSLPDRRTFTTKYPIKAIAEFVEPDEIYVLLTKDAEKLWGDFSQGLSGSDVVAKRILIPKTLKSDQPWTIFRRLADKIPQDSEVVLDITGGFRSIPVLGLSVFSYLSEVKNVKLVSIFYAAIDAARQAKLKPIFDLSVFSQIQRWANAVEVFNRTGDSSLLADLLTKESINVPSGNTQIVAETLKELSLGLDLMRLDTIMECAASLERYMEGIESYDEISFKPFGMLLEEIRKQYGGFALQEPRSPKFRKEYIQKQFMLMEWYFTHNRYVASVIVAQELMVSWYMTWRGDSPEDLFDKTKRKHASEAIHALWDAKANKKQAQNNEALKALILAWSCVPEARNDIAHLGMRPKGKSGEDNETTQLRKKIERAATAVKKLLDYLP